MAESALVGVPHADFGEVGVAVVMPKPAPRSTARRSSPSSRQSWPTSRFPKRCFVVAELPRNTMGKVQKNLLREQHKQLFA